MTGREHPLLEKLAVFVTAKRWFVLIPVVLLTIVMGFQIPSLEADPTPERFLASYGDDANHDTSFGDTFGESQNVIVVLLEARDALTRENLQYLHDLGRHFEGRPWVEGVKSVTNLPFPRFKGAPDEVTLDELDGEHLEDLEDLEDLDAADEEAGKGEVTGKPGVLGALSDLVDSADSPKIFPDGLGGLAARLDSQLLTDAIVKGDEVTDDEAAELRRVLSDAALVKGRLVSEDGTVGIAVLQLGKGEIKHEVVRDAAEEVTTYLEKHPPPSGSEAHLGGLPHLRNSIVAKMRTDRRVLMPLTVLICLILLYISYRWMAGTLLPLVAVGITAVLVVGGMALFHEQMNVLNNIIPPLLVIIGICESIHLVGRYREEIAANPDRQRAGRQTVRTMSVACLLAALTTAVGLGSLVVSGSDMLRHFGLIAAAGVMVAYVITVTFLPSALVSVPTPAHIERSERKGLERAVVTLTEIVLRHPWQILGVTAVLLAVSVWGATQVNVDHSLLDQFDPDDPVYKTTRLMENQLEGIRPLEVSLSSDQDGRFLEPDVLAAIERAQKWAEGHEEVIQSLSVADIFHETWYLLTEHRGTRTGPFRGTKQTAALTTILTQRDESPLHRFLTPDAKKSRIQLRLRDVGAKRTLRFIDDLRHQLLVELKGIKGVQIAFAGDAYTSSTSLSAVVRDLLASLLMAVGIIFVLLVVLLRSLRLGLLSIPSNVIPLVCTMAYMVVRGIPLNAATVIIFSISIGLAVDSTIHVLARYREETLKGLGSSQALLRAARGTGQAIVVSNVTLMAGFAVLMASSFLPVRHFGELIAVTVGGCLVATLVVQPALLKVAGLPRRAELEAASF